MNLDYTGITATLDWDNLTQSEALERLLFIKEKYSERLSKIEYRLSALSGFHVRLTFRQPIEVLRVRKELRDDGRRIANDIFNRPSHIHDILWDRKRHAGNIWHATPWRKFQC